jgi:hypothetical protein
MVAATSTVSVETQPLLLDVSNTTLKGKNQKVGWAVPTTAHHKGFEIVSCSENIGLY